MSEQAAIIVVIISIIISIAALSSGYISYMRSKRMLASLHQMLDQALNGTFTETSYDESSLSSLESKLNRYIVSSLASGKNLAREKDRIKALISDISHQTKTPVANMLLYSQLLQEHSQLPYECVQMAHQVVAQSEKLNFLIHSLVKASRLETGIIAVTPVKDDVRGLLISIFHDIGKKAENKNITVSLECGELTAVFDRKWSEEALFNILDNAVKYTPENGRISISAVPYELFSRIDITDTGIGMEEHEIPLIFNRFYRSPSLNQLPSGSDPARALPSSVDRYEGVGIGLFLSREIISAQGGYIKVASKLGKGSTFSVFLPGG